jgi:hypothetical protein
LRKAVWGLAESNGIKFSPDNPELDDDGKTRLNEDNSVISVNDTPRWLGSTWKQHIEERDRHMSHKDVYDFRNNIDRELDWEPILALLKLTDSKPVDKTSKKKENSKEDQGIWEQIGQALERNLWKKVVALEVNAPQPQTPIDRYHAATLNFTKGDYHAAETAAYKLMGELPSHALYLLSRITLETGRDNLARGFLIAGFERAWEEKRFTIAYYIAGLRARYHALYGEKRTAERDLGWSRDCHELALKENKVSLNHYLAEKARCALLLSENDQAIEACLERLTYCRKSDKGWLPDVYHQLALAYAMNHSDRALVYHQLAMEQESIRKTRDLIMRWTRFLVVSKVTTMDEEDFENWPPLYDAKIWSCAYDLEIDMYLDATDFAIIPTEEDPSRFFLCRADPVQLAKLANDICDTLLEGTEEKATVGEG